MGRYLALTNTTLAGLACLGYAYSRDWRHCIYWGAACVLTLSVTL
jgi:hypothetical protein